MVKDDRFKNAIKRKIGTAVDTSEMEERIKALCGQLKQVSGTKTRLEHQMDNLDVSDPHYDKKVSDLQRRYDEQYDKAEAIEMQIDEINTQMMSIRQEKISADNVYQLLLSFDKLYNTFTEAEQRDFMRSFIECIDIYPRSPKTAAESGTSCSIFLCLLRERKLRLCPWNQNQQSRLCVS